MLNGVILMVVGGLMAALCGSCTLINMGGELNGLVLFFGGLPTLIGIGLFIAGLLRVLRN